MVRRSRLLLYSGFPVGIRNITGSQSWPASSEGMAHDPGAKLRWSRIQGETGVIWWVRTGWIVRSGETVARFITAIPEKTGED
jgi:hypothetical protein